MSKNIVNKENEMVNEKGSIGEVQIADDVVATIAALASTEVEGVSSMYGNITKEIAGKLGIKNLSKGVNVLVEDGQVYIELAVTVHYGCAVKEVAKNIQQRVKNTVENMTGLNVSKVDVKIAGVNIDNYK